MQVFVSAKAAYTEQVDLLDLIEARLEAAGRPCFIATRELERRGLAPGFMDAIRVELQRSDLLIVLYAPELRGGLVELGIAYALDIPIWLLCQAGEKVSRTALECASKVISYGDLEDLRTKLQIESTD
ncbi:MAG: hypothetical protein KIS85_04075 [Anaerolineales bacterium]|nr:hypothetical protein [Anaerolineales bacterium]